VFVRVWYQPSAGLQLEMQGKNFCFFSRFQPGSADEFAAVPGNP
jgi:hypothetical protein